jgi:Kef-type K+ transport system membrane component KefB
MSPQLASIGAFDSTAVCQFLLAVAVLLGAARLLGEIARRYGLPPIVGEIVAGVLLGKTVMGRLAPSVYELLYGAQLSEAANLGLQALLVLAAVLLLLVAGLEVDLQAVLRKKKATLSVGLTSMLVPFVLGVIVAWNFPGALAHGDTENLLPFTLFIGVALAITALPVIAKILMDLGLQRSELGVVVLAAAVVNDLIGWMGFAAVLALVGTGTASSLWLTMGLTVGFAAFCLTVGLKLASPALIWVQARGGWPSGVLATVFTVAMLAAAFTEWIGVHAIFGAFLAGVVFADTGRLRERTQQAIEDIVGAIFAPLFFASIALKVDFLASFDLVAVVVIMTIAISGKWIGGWAGAWFAGMGQRESWAVGAGMTARGAMEIILAELALVAGIIGDETFVAIVIMSLATSILAGPMIEWILLRSASISVVSLLSRSRIVIGMKAESAPDAIRELGELAGLSGPAIEAMIEGEEGAPTGMSGGWALPHCRDAAITKSLVALGICKAGFDFACPAGDRARVIVMLASPIGVPDEHVQCLSAIARVFGRANTCRELQESKSANEIVAVVRHAES